jgi:hypothetical protein
MATVQDLVVTLGANTAPLSSGLSKARGDVRGFANDVKSTMGGTFEKFGTQIQSATYAVDDFVAGFSTGGIAGGIRGAANNIAQLGSQIGGVQGLLVGVAIGAGATIFTKIMQWSDDSGKSLDKLTEKFQTLQKAAFQPLDFPKAPKPMEGFASQVGGMTSAEAARRAEEVAGMIGVRQGNAAGFAKDQERAKALAVEQARLLEKELGVDNLGRSSLIKEALLRGKSYEKSVDPFAGMGDAAGLAGGGMVNVTTRNLSDDQRKRLELLLQITEHASETEAKAAENVREMQTLQNEAAALAKKSSPLGVGLAGAAGLMGGGPGRVTAGMGNARIPGNVGLALVTEMRGMMREGEQLGDLNQSVRDRLDEKPLGKPSEGFAGAAEQGSMEAARIVLGAMGQNRTMEIQKAQLDVAKQQVNEIKKLGVGLKTNTKAVGVVGDLTA